MSLILAGNCLFRKIMLVIRTAILDHESVRIVRFFI